MHMSSPKRRSGLTLLEVLITIFVMGIGMLSVLTLFPLAARKIGMSIDMDRASQMAANASALDEIRGIRTKVNNYLNSLTASTLPSDIIIFDEPGFQGGAYTSPGRTPTIFNTSLANALFSVPFNRNLAVSQDEYPFTDSGAPESGSRRSERYSSAHLFRRQRLDDAKSLDSMILVFAGRPIDFGNRFDFPITITSGGIAWASDTITITDPATYTAGDQLQPDRRIMRGSWIMDYTNKRWKRFYKVVSVDSSTTGSLTLTLDRLIEDDDAIQGSSDDGTTSSDWTNPAKAKLIWIDYMVDWFDRGSAP